MYHKIKSMMGENSVRQTAEVLGISAGCVQKYSKMSLEEGAFYVKQLKRRSQFDEVRSFIEEQLKSYPKMTATKLLRKIKIEHTEITVGVRALRNYIKPIRAKYRNNKIRHYRPVFDTIQGEQIQVDAGEYRVQINSSGQEMKVYFVSFVFSYSGMMYVSFQQRPYKTDDFIKAHLEAFHYFGGVAKEYVYDQTKLVVIEEKYREVWFNEQFHQFALKYEFLPVVCAGYDPESKGKVERSIRYIKEDFLYGDIFLNIESVRKASFIWLDEVANVRIHSRTRRQPSEMFLEEKPFLNTHYYTKNEANQRFADKTGLISFKGNKYSVPSFYQRKKVIVERAENILFIRDYESGKEIAKHRVSLVKGKTIINNNHYRDFRKSIEEITVEVLSHLSEVKQAGKLVERIKSDNPKIVRDQLKGLKKLASKFPADYWNEALPDIFGLPQIRTSLVEKMLVTLERNYKFHNIDNSNQKYSLNLENSSLDRSLKVYMSGVKNA